MKQNLVIVGIVTILAIGAGCGAELLFPNMIPNFPALESSKWNIAFRLFAILGPILGGAVGAWRVSAGRHGGSR